VSEEEGIQVGFPLQMVPALKIWLDQQGFDLIRARHLETEDDLPFYILGRR
jgi:hypothetical protein